jgi:hypothetical protein
VAVGVGLLCTALAGRRAPAARGAGVTEQVVTSPAPGAVKPPPPAPAEPPVLRTQPPSARFKRLDTLTEEELRGQLRDVPEVALDQVPDTSKALVAAARASPPRSYPGPAAMLSGHATLGGLPFLADSDCRLNQERARDLDELSKAIHEHVQNCTSGSGPGARLNAARLRQLLAAPRHGRAQWADAEALPALLQILQVEEAPARRLLVDLLGEMEAATPALAFRAVFDLSPGVRQTAVRALGRRSPKVYRDVLLAGLRYPWPPAAAHAAEALVALGDTGAVPALKALLDEPPPGLPSPADAAPTVRELVRVNHLKNCLLCHPPSFNERDAVRGVVPDLSRPPGSSGVGYVGGPADVFVRADVTYLRQDFSLPQPVDEPPKGWPAVQRYDYVVRVRTLAPQDLPPLLLLSQQRKKEYRAAVQFALRELRGAAP